MEPFTILDVIRYNDYIKHYRDYLHLGRADIIEALVNDIIRKFKDQGAKDALKYFGAWLRTGFVLNPNTSHVNTSHVNTSHVQTTKIDIPFKIIQGQWQEHEYTWFRDIFQSHLVYTKIVKWFFGGLETRTLSNAKELLIVFVEIMRQKFGNDDNLMCVLDDYIKRFNMQ